VITLLIAPIMMMVIIPQQIAISTGVRPPKFDSPGRIVLATIGLALMVAGLILFSWTVILFHRIGRGTLGVGKVLGEPVHLVVRGPYRYVRNPMVTAAVSILLGEAAVTASGWLMVWAATFWSAQRIMIRFWEEPHLTELFDGEYAEFRCNVPAWIPRCSGWDAGR
jgi:protein-S-isoprenylcysteine O-methyltransferase Ste14